MAAEQRSSDGNQRFAAAEAADQYTIEVRVRDLHQLFHSLDPSPFEQKNLDPDAEEYIVSAAREIPPKARAALVVYVDQPTAGLSDEQRVLAEAMRVHFARRAQLARQRLRQLLRRGWISMIIGLVLLAGSVVVGETVARRMGQGPLATVLRESLLIGGWVAMSRPIEILLYDWWTIRGERRVYERLSRMPVRLVNTGGPAGASGSADASVTVRQTAPAASTT